VYCEDHFQTNSRSGVSEHFAHTNIVLRKASRATRVSTLINRLIELERDQKADEGRIDAALRKAEADIANLLKRYASPEALRKAIAVIRDKTALMTRDVRKNMHERSVAAMKLLDKSMGLDFRSHRSRFAAEDAADAALRTRFFELLERMPTSALLTHLKDALEHGNIACAESIWFEFACRADRHLYSAEFDAIRGLHGDADQAEMHIRLIAIVDAAAKVDRKLAEILCRGGQDDAIDTGVATNAGERRFG
jgi:hypothetical protein